MASISEPRSNLPLSSDTVVNYEEPPVKPPPLLSVGMLAWMRKNLFHSAADTILTFVSIFILISMFAGLLQWAVSSANWLVITRNMRLFMLGTFPPESAWRIEIAALIFSFVIGWTLVAYTRVNRVLVGVLAALLIITVVIPPLIRATVPPVPLYLAAGETSIQSGSITEQPQEYVGFIGRQGDTATFTLAESGVSLDALAQTAGFTDRASQALINGALNRLTAETELAALEQRLARDLLTDAQRAEIQNRVTNANLPPIMTEVYQVNQAPITLEIFDGEMNTVLTQVFTTPGDSVSYTLPSDGWYVLRKTVDSEDAVGMLEVRGVSPLLQRDLGAGNVTFSRINDEYDTTAARPQVDGRPVPALFLGDNQYQNQRPFGDYLRIAGAPMLDLLARGFVPMTIFGVLGFAAATAVTRLTPTSKVRGDRRGAVRWLVPWLWILAMIFLFILAYGSANLDAAGLGLLLSRFAWVGAMFFAGMTIRQVWGRPAFGALLLFGVIQSLFAERILTTDGLNTGSLLPKLLGLALWLVIGILAARQGAGLRDRFREQQARLGLIGSVGLWIALFVIPLILFSNAGSNLMPPVDTRRWGGFLLTMMLTVIAIVASFPLGVGLALGRRSKMPAIRLVCTVYIELVRGVPLITVLFMAQLLVPLVNASLSNVDNVIRAMVGLTLFSGAYLAENVRGGLQSIPPGQEEAAKAVGLAGWQVTFFIMLPQALRAVIPALVGQCIALFKDTSLVALVGLTDLTGIARAAIAQTEFIGLQAEVFAFITVIYFVISYLMAYISRKIESSGSGAARQV